MSKNGIDRGTKWYNSAQNGTIVDRMVQWWTEWHNSGQNGARVDRMVQEWTIYYNTRACCNTTEHVAILQSMLQYLPVCLISPWCVIHHFTTVHSEVVMVHSILQQVWSQCFTVPVRWSCPWSTNEPHL